MRENTFKNTSDKGLLPKTYKEHLRLNNRKINNLIKKWTNNLNRHLTKEDTQMTYMHRQRCFTSYIIRSMQIKTTMRHHYTTIRMFKIQNPDTKGWSSSKEGDVVCMVGLEGSPLL